MKSILPFLLALNLFLACRESRIEAEENRTESKTTTPIINYAVINTFPHDTSLFTEGFLIHEGQLFESTGSPQELVKTKSLIGVVDLKTGKFNKKVEIDKKKYFGEGITVFKDKLFQLTYKNKKGFIYDANSFRKIGQFRYSNAEGWGLTTNGTELIMSDGTERLFFLNPNNFKPVKTLSVTENGAPVQDLNELEYIKGYIYANIWNTNYIAKIDPMTGKVVGKLDLSSLSNEAKHKHPNSEVLNGIAYDSTTDRIFVTGKFWPSIYQIDFAHNN